MLVLGLDTSSPAVSAALVELGPGDLQVLAESVVVDGRRHGELLAQGVRSVLDGRRPDAIVVGAGPGPFTGLRVGLMTAAAMSDALCVPSYSVCSLDGLADDDGDVVVVTDARRREVYWARYVAGERVEGPEVVRPADLAARLVPGERLVGAGAVLHRDVLGEVDGSALHPSVPRLIARVAERVLAGEPGDALTPLYLRRPDAVEPGAAKRVTPQ